MNTNFNLAEISEAIAAAIPERECIVFRDRRHTWRQFNERTRRLGNYLHGRGLGCHQERAALQDGSDLRKLPKMLLKGKMKIKPPSTGGRGAVAKIFEQVRSSRRAK